MTSNPDPVADAAKRVAEGRRVDWGGLCRDHPEQRARLENLRRLESLARLARPGRDDLPLRGWGHLEIREHLGSGSFGEVYAAHDPILQREVALKLRRPESASDQDLLFIAEARRLARIRHPNVLGVHGADLFDGRAGVWCELLTGSTLEQRLAEGPAIDTAAALETARDLARALAAVHAAGVVHGDVKAANVGLEPGEPSERAILMDFGAGVDLTSPGTRSPFASPLTAAPEQLEDRRLEPAVDIYALGVLLYRLLNGGQYPVEADSVVALSARQHAGEPERAARSMPGISPDIRALVSRMLHFEPERRPAAQEVARRLTWIINAPGRRSRRRAVAAVILSLTAALVASGVGWYRSRQANLATEQARVQAEHTSDFLTQTLAAPRGAVSGRQVRIVDILDEAATDLLADSDLPETVRSELLMVVAQTYLSLGRGAEAEPLLEAAREVRVDLFGTSDARVAAVDVRLGEAAFSQRRFDDATALLDEVLAREVADQDTRHLAALLRARVDDGRGEYGAARDRIRRLLEGRPGPGEETSEILALAWLDLGQLEGALGDAHRQIEIYRPLLARVIEMHGDRHPTTFAVRNGLAVALAAVGRRSESVQIFSEISEQSAAWLGPDDPYTVRTETNLAAALKESGELNRAAALEASILERVGATEGESSIEYCTVLGNHAVTLMQLGQLEAASVALEQASRGLETALGPDHPLTLIHSGVNRAELLLAIGRPSTALNAARRAEAGFAKALGDRHPFTLAASSLAGAAMAATGASSQGLETLRQVLALQTELFGDADLQTLTTRIHLAEALDAAGRSSEAATIRAGAHATAQASLGPDHPLTLRSRPRIGGPS